LKKTIIRGGPGTGKTHMLMEKIEDLLKDGINFNNMAFVSFTKAAAYEGRERVQKISGVKLKDIEYFRTIHSMCYRLLGLEKDMVIKSANKKEFCEKYGIPFAIERDINVDDYNLGSEIFDQKRIGNQIFAFYDRLRNVYLTNMSGISEQLFWKYWNETYMDSSSTKYLISLNLYNFLLKWEAYKTGAGLYDFSDMLYNIYKQKLSPSVKYLIVDEFQDLTRLQYEIIRMWSKDMKRVIYAGDPDQSIYPFMGASPEYFWEEWKSATKNGKIKLKTSHRIRNNIRIFAQEFLKNNANPTLPPTYKSEKSDGVVKKTSIVSMSSLFFRIGELLKKNRKIFFLARTNYQKDEFTSILKKRGTPYINMGRGEQPWTKRTVSIHNALQKIQSGETLSEDESITLFLNVASKNYLEHGLKTKIRSGDVSFSEKNDIEYLRGVGVEGLFFDLSYDQKIDALLPSSTSKTIKRVLKNAKNIGLVNNINLYTGTIHSSKGKEAHIVIVLTDLTKNIYKSLKKQTDKENEARVWYVAFTRASDELVLVEYRRNNPMVGWI